MFFIIIITENTRTCHTLALPRVMCTYDIHAFMWQCFENIYTILCYMSYMYCTDITKTSMLHTEDRLECSCTHVIAKAVSVALMQPPEHSPSLPPHNHHSQAQKVNLAAVTCPVDFKPTGHFSASSKNVPGIRVVTTMEFTSLLTSMS